VLTEFPMMLCGATAQHIFTGKDQKPGFWLVGHPYVSRKTPKE